MQTISISNEEEQGSWATIGNTSFNTRGLRVVQHVDTHELFLRWEDGYEMRVSGAGAAAFFESFIFADDPDWPRKYVLKT